MFVLQLMTQIPNTLAKWNILCIPMPCLYSISKPRDEAMYNKSLPPPPPIQFFQLQHVPSLSSVVEVVETTFGENWDYYLISVLTGLLVLIICWRRR